MLHFSFSRVIVGCALLTIAAPAMPASADWARLTIPDVGDQVVANSRGAVFALVSQQVKILEANGQWATIQGNGDSTWAVRAIAAGGNRLLAHHATKDQIWEWNGISWSLISDGPRVAAMAVDGAGTAYVMLTGVVFMKQLAGATDWTISNIGQQMVRLLAGGSKVFGTGTDGILYQQSSNGFSLFLDSDWQPTVTDDGVLHVTDTFSLWSFNGSSWTNQFMAPQKIFGRDRLLEVEGGRLRMLNDGILEDLGGVGITQAIVAGEYVFSRGAEGSKRHVNTAGNTINVNTDLDTSTGSVCSLRMAITAAQQNRTVGTCAAGAYGQEDAIVIPFDISSPAVNKGATCRPRDLITRFRPRTGSCDLGAIESF